VLLERHPQRPIAAVADSTHVLPVKFDRRPGAEEPAGCGHRGSLILVAERYFHWLSAPAKELIWFERLAHLPNAEERDRFTTFMIDRVLPIAKGSAPVPSRPATA
jgi:hypothetical protein